MEEKRANSASLRHETVFQNVIRPIGPTRSISPVIMPPPSIDVHYVSGLSVRECVRGCVRPGVRPVNSITYQPMDGISHG